MEKLHLDFETRSEADLKAVGVHNYAEDPSTEIVCAAWAIDDGPVQAWRAWKGEPLPAELRHALLTAEIWAHNAQFERLIIENVLVADIPSPPLERYWCTATQCRLNGLPGGLGDAALALGLDAQKDKRGIELIRMCSIPPYNEDPEILEEFTAYCMQDVEVERALACVLREPTEQERLLYWTSERINDRGFAIDRDLAWLCSQYAEAEKKDIARRIAELTDGAVTKTQGTKLRDWVYNRLPPEARPVMHVTRKVRQKHEVKVSFDSGVREAILENPHAFGLDPVTYEVIELAHEAGRASSAKFNRMLSRAPEWMPRVRGAYIMSGAMQTSRFSSTGVQVHNLPRLTLSPDQLGAALRLMREGADATQISDALDMPILDVLKGALRPAILSPGGRFIGADWSAIEARAAPWLAQGPGVSEGAQRVAQDVLDTFARGEDLYVKQAARIYDVDESAVDTGQRLVGKVAVLSLGFLGGVGALLGMARAYGVALDEEEAERIVWAWRAANPWAVEFGQALERAAIRAIRRPGEVFDAGRVQYLYQPGVLGRGCLWCLLPSGRLMAYPDCDLEVEEDRSVIKYLKGSVKPKSGEPWPRWSMWRGLFVENVTQCVCAHLLGEKLIEVEAGGLDVVLHTHDEIVVEAAGDDDHDAILAQLIDTMTTAPSWAAGLPLAAEGWISERYRK